MTRGSISILAAVLTLPLAAEAHGLDAGQMIVRLAGNTAYFTVTPHAALFAPFDDNSDGRISRRELRAHRGDMATLFATGFEVLDESGRVGKPIFWDMGVPHTHRAPAGKGHVRFTLRYRWKSPPSFLAIRYDHGDLAPMAVRGRRMTAGLLANQRPLGPLLTARLDAGKSRLEIFGPPRRAAVPRHP